MQRKISDEEFNAMIDEIASAPQHEFDYAISKAWAESEQVRRDNFEQDFKNAILEAADRVCDEFGYSKITDQDLPNLFDECLEPLIEKLASRNLKH